MFQADDVSSVGNIKQGQKYDCYDSSLVYFLDHLFINIITVKIILKVQTKSTSCYFLNAII